MAEFPKSPAEEFFQVFDDYDSDFINTNKMAKDTVFLTQPFCYSYKEARDESGYSIMHYCVASLIANHKYKQNDGLDVFMYKYSTDELDEQWKTENRWVRAVNIFLSVLNHGHSINAPKIFGHNGADESPLMFAIEKHAPLDVLKLLIKYGAYIDQELVSGTSVLSICYYNNYYEAAKLLLEMGADPNVIDDGLSNPLTYALDEYEREEPDFEKLDKFINLFLDYGSDPDWCDEFVYEYRYNYDAWFDNQYSETIRDHKIKTFELMKKYRKNNDNK